MSWFGIAPILFGFVLFGLSAVAPLPDGFVQMTLPGPRLEAALETPVKEGPATILEYRFEYLPTSSGIEKERVAFTQTLEKRLQERFGLSGWRLSFDAKEPRFTVRIDPPADRARIDAFRTHVETVGQVSVHAVADDQYQNPTVVERTRQEVAAWQAKCEEARRAGKSPPPSPARLVVESKQGSPLVVETGANSIARDDIAKLEQTADPNTGQPAVSFSMTASGAPRLSELTERIRGQRLAIVIDGQAVSVATVASRITNSGVISGIRSPEECATLVRIFHSGALPAKPMLLSEKQEERL